MLVNIVPRFAFLPGATPKVDRFGMIEITYQGKKRTFTRELIFQLPNKSVQAFIKQSFDKPD